MEAAGFRPFVARATRDNRRTEREVWGVNPNTQERVMITNRAEWDRYKAVNRIVEVQL